MRQGASCAWEACRDRGCFVTAGCDRSKLKKHSSIEHIQCCLISIGSCVECSSGPLTNWKMVFWISFSRIPNRWCRPLLLHGLTDHESMKTAMKTGTLVKGAHMTPAMLILRLLNLGSKIWKLWPSCQCCGPYPERRVNENDAFRAVVKPQGFRAGGPLI